jgi:hypothetical protein
MLNGLNHPANRGKDIRRGGRLSSEYASDSTHLSLLVYYGLTSPETSGFVAELGTASRAGRS